MGYARVRRPAEDPGAVVVAVVRGGAAVRFVGRDAHLHTLPIVTVVIHSAPPRRVRVVGPVLNIEMARPLAAAVVTAASALGPGELGPAIDDVDERDRRLAGVRSPDRAGLRAASAALVATLAKVDRQGGHPLLVDDLGSVLLHLGRELGAVGGDEVTALPARRRHARGAEDSQGDRLREPYSRQPRAHSRREREYQRGDDDEQADPLDGALPGLAGDAPRAP